MNTDKDFVPYQPSLDMKEIGFDEPCLMYYDYSWTLVESGVYECKAPLYQQAFRWFREKYGLRIRNYVFVNYSGGISEGFEIFKYSKDTIDRVEALTYEEAEFECLKKLIEIVKNK